MTKILNSDVIANNRSSIYLYDMNSEDKEIGRR